MPAVFTSLQSTVRAVPLTALIFLAITYFFVTSERRFFYMKYYMTELHDACNSLLPFTDEVCKNGPVADPACPDGPHKP